MVKPIRPPKRAAEIIAPANRYSGMGAVPPWLIEMAKRGSVNNSAPPHKLSHYQLKQYEQLVAQMREQKKKR